MRKDGTIVHDRVTERMRIVADGDGFMHIYREYQINTGEWRVDPEAGVSWGREHTAEVLASIAVEAEKRAVAYVQKCCGKGCWVVDDFEVDAVVMLPGSEAK